MGVSTSQNPYVDALASAKGIAGGLPFIAGKWFFVDPTSGSASNDGLTPQTAFALITTAYTACTTGAGDGIAVISRGTTAAGCTSYLTTALDWTKWGITVVGICAPTRFSQRARISTAALNLAYLIDVQGSNNSFYNLSFYNGGTTGAGGVIVSGDRNYFERVHFMGGMGMTTATITDYSLKLSGADENTFVDCTIGSDTVDKTDIAGTELLIDRNAAMKGCSRNRFYGCEFVSFRSAGTTAGMVKLNATGDSILRNLLFDNCFFQMYRNGAVSVEVSIVIGTLPNNGLIVFKDCLRLGFVDWGAVANTRIYSGSMLPTEAGGIAIITNPS